MRVTSLMMGQTYRNNLSKAQGRLNDATIVSTNFRKFQRISEDPSRAAKAFQLRQEYSKMDSYKRSVETAKGRVDTAEGSMKDIVEMMKTLKERMITSANGTTAPEDREIMAQEMRAIQTAVLQDMNIAFMGQHLFGGTEATKAPLTVDGNGKLLYKGQSLEPADYASQSEYQEAIDKMLSDPLLLDLGYGINVDDYSSGFDISMPAIQFLGYGTSSTTGLSGNLYNFINQAVEYLESDNFSNEEFGKYLDQFNDCYKTFLTSYTNLAGKAQSLEYSLNRLENNLISVTEKINYVEYVEPEEAITSWKWEQFAYQSALAVGTQVIQPSLLDYLR